jgi:plasminogen activator inhibitor 1 RNA-binding protein
MISGKTSSLSPRTKRKMPTLSERFVFLFLLSPFTDLVPKSKSAPKARPKKEEKVYLEIEARFDRPERGGRGRGRGDRSDRGGDRGGDRGRGRGSRGPKDGGRQNGAASTNVDDQAAFPSLT